MAEASARPSLDGGMPIEVVFELEGVTQEVGANRPVVVEPDRAVRVVEGTLDLFLQGTTDVGLGRRRLLCSVAQGDVLWSGGPTRLPEGWRMVAVGHAGTIVSLVSSRSLQHLPTEVLTPGAEALALAAARTLPGPLRELVLDHDGPAGESALAAAHARFQRVVTAAIEQASVGDVGQADRIAARPARDARRLRAALLGLAGVVNRTESRSTSDDRLDELAVALSHIGAYLGVEFPEHVPEASAATEPVDAMARLAGSRTRVVSLRGAWWRDPGEPLLAFRGDAERPVALVPGPRRRYRLFDPTEGGHRTVDADLAAELATEAYTFYRPAPDGTDTLVKVLRFGLQATGSDLRLLTLMAAVVGVIALATPLITGVVYSRVLPSGDEGHLVTSTTILLGVAIAGAAVTLSRNLYTTRLGGRLAATLQPAVLDRLLQLGSDFFRRHDTGDLATRVDAVQIMQQQLSGSVMTSLLTAIFSSFSLFLLFVYSPTLAIISIAVLATTIGVLVALNVRVLRRQRQQYAVTRDLSGQLFQLMMGVRKIRVAGAETRVMVRWAERFRAEQQATYAAGSVQVWITSIIAAVPALASLVLFVVAGTFLRDSIDTGDYVAFAVALGQFTAAATAMTFSIGPLVMSVVMFEMMQPILTEPLEQNTGQDPGTLSGHITLADVRFSYGPDTPEVIKGISLDIAPGEFVALTGPSGSGKSTVLRLLLGLDEPDAGSVLFDNKELSLLDVRQVRRQLGVVMQDAQPIPGELLTTIVGTVGGSEEEAWAAAEAAGLADDIREMPMRMHTIIGEGGSTFSGGQIQRLMIAKAVVRKPKILFFDEATSALDDRTQARVSEFVDTMQATRVVVAHRLSTIRNADRICVIVDGELVQEGRFEELVNQDGPFQELARRQML